MGLDRRTEHPPLYTCKGFRSKSGRDEQIYLTAKARMLLGDLPRLGELVFVCPAPPQVSKRFLYWRRRAGLRHGSFHSLRHTCASWMATNGVNPIVIKEHLRHSSIQVTERYVHLSPTRRWALIEDGLSQPLTEQGCDGQLPSHWVSPDFAEG